MLVDIQTEVTCNRSRSDESHSLHSTIIKVIDVLQLQEVPFFISWKQVNKLDLVKAKCFDPDTSGLMGRSLRRACCKVVPADKDRSDNLAVSAELQIDLHANRLLCAEVAVYHFVFCFSTYDETLPNEFLDHNFTNS